MSDFSIITGLVSLFGCLCMGFVCARALVELAAAAKPVQIQPWEHAAEVIAFRHKDAGFAPRLIAA